MIFGFPQKYLVKVIIFGYMKLKDSGLQIPKNVFSQIPLLHGLRH